MRGKFLADTREKRRARQMTTKLRRVAGVSVELLLLSVTLETTRKCEDERRRALRFFARPCTCMDTPDAPGASMRCTRECVVGAVDSAAKRLF